MKKLALFVEGQTELIFCEYLIQVLFGELNYAIQTQRASGRKKARQITTITAKENGNNGADYYFLIRDCGNDRSVISDLRDDSNSLFVQGYELALGIRDLFPDFSVDDLERFEKGLQQTLENCSIPITPIIAVVETETWFLFEYKHFKKLDPKLTPTQIRSERGIDVKKDNFEVDECSASKLASIYSLAGIDYDKSEKVVLRIMNSMSAENLANYVSKRSSSFNSLYMTLKGFIA